MSNLNKIFNDEEGIYISIIKKMLSTDEKKIYNYFINNEGYLSSKEQKLLIKILDLECLNDIDCKNKIVNTTSKDILTKIIKNKVDDTILFLKLMFITVLIVASIINRDIKFIKNHTTMFVVESLIFIMLGTLSFFILVLFRDKSFSMMTYIFVMIFYFVLHLLFQISGIYSSMYSTKEVKTTPSGMIKNVRTIVLYTLYLLTFVYLIYILIIMTYVNDKPDYLKNSSYFKFILEMLIFGILNSIIFYPVAIDRQNRKDPLNNIIKGIKDNTFGITGMLVSIVQMCLLHVVLQYTGFYRSVGL